MRKSWVYINGVAYEKGADDEAFYQMKGGGNGPTVLPDLPDFVSPIDGKLYSGRAGLRDHCDRHSVVPTSDLEGLPSKPVAYTAPHTKEQREQTRRVIADIINSRGY